MKRVALSGMQIVLLYLRTCSPTFLTTRYHNHIQYGSPSKRVLSMTTAKDSSSIPVDLKYIEFTTTNNKSDNVVDVGDPVLFLHGLLGQKRNWVSLGTALANQLERKRRIYALDLRNHGDNTHDWRDEMTYTQMAEDVLQFINQQNIKKAVCIGHSMGGKVAKVLALQYPQRISGLVVLDIAPVSYNSTVDSNWKAVETIIQALGQVQLNHHDTGNNNNNDMLGGKSKKDLEMELRSTIQDPALRAFALTNIETIRMTTQPTITTQDSSSNKSTTLLRWKVNLNAIQKQLHILAGFDYQYPWKENQEQNLGKVILDESKVRVIQDECKVRYHGDTFFILGGQSKFVRNSHLTTIAHHFPNYMMTTIKGSGHWVHSEAPDDTLLLLKRYLDR